MFRRLLSIVLLAVFSLPLLAEAAAWTGPDAEARLPACCRRHGAHRCSMIAAEDNKADNKSESKGPALSARCRMWPLRSTLPGARVALAMPRASRLAATPLTLSMVCGQAEAGRRTAIDRARHKRGPPFLVL